MYLPALLLSPIMILIGILVYLNRFKIFGFTIAFNNRAFGDAGRALAKKSSPKMIIAHSAAIILFGVGLGIYGLIGR
ncbi:hypothetical protein ACHABX_08750 [Nesterenkonia halotolerans]|uniref:hypothetical protein n=1 Tax=Nesterenkonia halotolerans TaxID=225325 RepID=UPI003EE658EA